MPRLLLSLALLVVFLPGAVHAQAPETVEQDRFEKEILVPACTDPMSLDVLSDGRVLFIERLGTLKMYRPSDKKTLALGTVPTASYGEVGMLGLAADRDFLRTGHVYFLYCPARQKDTMRVSRFTVQEDKLELASEKKLLDYKIDVAGALHMGGGLVMDGLGNLYVGVGDNTPPIDEVPTDPRPGKELSDSFRTAGNTRDLRGKILRIHPEPDGTYTIPKDNLLSDRKWGYLETFAMGCRNPFRLAVDPKTNVLWFGDVGNNVAPTLDLGAEGYDEVNRAPKAGNFGWPMFTGPNEPFKQYDFATKKVGLPWDVKNPVNPSPNNTGIKKLPPPLPALLWYGTGPSKQFPELGSGGRSIMVGPVYYHDPARKSDVQLPAHYDHTLFIYDWMRNWIKAVKLDADDQVAKIEPFLPTMSLRKPIDLKTGPDGALYLAEFGDKWGDNTDAQIVRLVYRRGNRPPTAVALAAPTAGKSPLTVKLDGRKAFDKDKGDRLTYIWTAPGGTLADASSAQATATYAQPGSYTATLTVKDAAGASSEAKVQIMVGNAPPVVRFIEPTHGGFFDWGQPVEYKVHVTDEEDTKIAPERITVQAAYTTRRGTAAAHPGLALMKKTTCFACHAAGDQSKGPPYALVAQKYKDDTKARDRLAQKVISGGAGAWGAYPMPPHPQHTLAQTRLMLDWVLSLASGQDVPPQFGPVGGFLAPPFPGLANDHGVLILDARYTDNGAGQAPPLTGMGTTLLHARKKKAAFADERHGIEVVHELEGKDILAEGMLARFGPGDTVVFKEMNLAGIDRVTMLVGSLEGVAGAFDLRADSPTGPVLARVNVPNKPGYQKKTVPLADPGGLHDLYVVARTKDSRKALSLIWLEFHDAEETSVARQEQAAAARKRLAAVKTATKVRPFVRDWKLADLTPSLKSLDSGRSFQRGQELFRAASCVTCHKLGKEGGTLGPDLTDVAGRLAKEKQPRLALLREVLEPSKVIDPKYRTHVVVTDDGTQRAGIIMEQDAATIRLAANPAAPEERLTIPRARIESLQESPVSLMPVGLLSTLTRDEIFDLLAYVEAGGNPQSAAFKRVEP